MSPVYGARCSAGIATSSVRLACIDTDERRDSSRTDRDLRARSGEELVELFPDERRDATAVSQERRVEPLFGLVVETVTVPENGVPGDLWMVDADDTDRAVRAPRRLPEEGTAR